MNKEEFQKIEKLYHYTSVCSALKILASNRLKFGELKKMNDINEVYRNVFCKKEMDATEVNQELEKYKQFSFSQDSDCYRGYAIPAMWGHYAERGYGVCLVFDKKQLLELLPSNMKCGEITYSSKYDGSIIVGGENIPEYFEKYVQELFFTKTKDWSYEQEFRVLKKGGEDYLPLKNSLIAVIMCYAADVKSGDSVFGSCIAKGIEETFQVPVLEMGYWDGEVILRDEQGDAWEKEFLDVDSLDV